MVTPTPRAPRLLLLEAAAGRGLFARGGRPATDLLGLAVVSLCFFFVALGARDLWNPNEPVYGRAVVEMEENGSWTIPTVNGRVFAEKPILYFWAARAASSVLGGVDELSLRVPSALSAIASVLLTYLLVLPYVGRRRALWASALFATLYQVFWAARAVQMDILVLISTLGVVLPLTRRMDFGLRPARAWAWAGLAAGLGFAAKGPVSLVLPAIVIAGYALARGKLRILVEPQMLIGVAVAVAAGSPWFILLWLDGETAFLYEVLWRQNFQRFVNAWDHDQPWWYFLEYLWLDYAPWAWLLPAAWFLAPKDEGERRLHRLSWIWIAGIVVFFSLSDSKRAPYILPVAPAVAVLAAAVVDRWVAGRLENKSRVAAIVALALLATLLLVGGIGVLVAPLEIPPALVSVASVVGALLAVTGAFTVFGILRRKRFPRLAPSALLAGVTALFLVAAVWALPATDPLKSARVFSETMNVRVGDGTLASFGLWDWRSGYSYYADRSIDSLEDETELRRFWEETEKPFVLVEDRHVDVVSALPDAELVEQRRIGSRTASLFTRSVVDTGLSRDEPSAE